MPTNYLFAGLNSLRPNTQAPKTTFAQPTQDLSSGVVARTSVGVTPTPQQSTFSPSVSGSIVSGVRERNAQANQFGQDITDIQMADKQRKDALAQQQNVVNSSDNGGKDYSAPGDVSQTSAVYDQRATGARQQLVSQATSLLGTPYAWGGGGYHNRSSRGTGLGTENVIGVDCSGLTSYAYGQLGIKIPRVAAGQLTTMGYKTNVKNLAPGDLVGWNGLGHVAMYIGNGQIVESPKVGATVRVRSLGSSDASRGVFGVHVKLPGE